MTAPAVITAATSRVTVRANHESEFSDPFSYWTSVTDLRAECSKELRGLGCSHFPGPLGLLTLLGYERAVCQQLAFDQRKLSVHYSKQVQLSAACEGEMLRRVHK